MDTDLKTFLVEDENGEQIEATELTRIKVEDTDLEYLIYSIDDENTKNLSEEEKQVIIMAAKVIKDENGEEVLMNLEDDEEKQAVYEAFSDSYKKSMQQK